MRLWIGFKSENIRPTQSSLKNILPVIPYERAVIPEIINNNLLQRTYAKLTIIPYYKIQYSLLENVRLPWYQQVVVEDKGTVIINVNTAELLNARSTNYETSPKIIKELSRVPPVKELVIEASANYQLENREWDIKVDDYKAEALANNCIKERNHRNIPYDDRYEGRKYQAYLPSHRAITILSKDLILVPIWHFKYSFKGKNFERMILASSGEILASDFLKRGVLCEECGKIISKESAYHCLSCNKWVCSLELIECSSCQGIIHKIHPHKICSVCNQALCDNCTVICPVCNKEYGQNHSVSCRDCGIIVCSSCIEISGLFLKKKRCPSCEAESKKK